MAAGEREVDYSSMDTQLFIILLLTFVIHLIGTIAYAFRIAAVRTGHVAIAFSLFNILVLVSRTSNSFQGPFIAKRVELAITDSVHHNLLFDFQLIMLAASVATIVGGLLIPTFQRYASVAVTSFKANRSIGRLVTQSATKSGFVTLKSLTAMPKFRQMKKLKLGVDIPVKIVALNVVATALWSVAVLASIYAGYLYPDFRVTASTLSSVINGFATIALFILIDPYLSGLTDDTVKASGTDTAQEAHFRRVVVWMIISRLMGTILAQVLFIPSAYLIGWLAIWI